MRLSIAVQLMVDACSVSTPNGSATAMTEDSPGAVAAGAMTCPFPVFAGCPQPAVAANRHKRIAARIMTACPLLGGREDGADGLTKLCAMGEGSVMVGSLELSGRDSPG